MKINKKSFFTIFSSGAVLILLHWGIHNPEKVYSLVSLTFGLLMPVFLGLCIAFVLNVPMSAIERTLFGKPQKGKAELLRQNLKRPVSFILALLFVVAVISLVIFLVVPELIKTVRIIGETIPEFGKRMQDWLAPLIEATPGLQSSQILSELNWKTLFSKGWDVLHNSMTSLVGSTFVIASSVFSGLVNFGLGFVFSAYILLQKEECEKQSKRVLYAFLSTEKADRFLYICNLSNRIFTNFLTGQCLEAVILGGMFFVCMNLLGFPYSLLISVLIAFTALIPVFGAFIGMAVGVFLIMVNNPMQAVWFVVLFLILQQIEGNFIYPKVVGSSVGLPALWVLLAVTLGGSMMGVFGMLVMVPAFSVLYALFWENVNKRIDTKRALHDTQSEQLNEQ